MTLETESGAQDRSVLRWGGLIGMLGGVLFILSAILLVTSSFSTAPADPAGLVMKFPDIRTVVAVAETFDLLAVLSWAALFVTLYRALRGASPASALFGSAIGVLGLAMLLVGALTYVAFDPISSLYHAPGVTPAIQASLVNTWQAIQGVFNETDTVGFLLVSVGFVILGLSMQKERAFGRYLGTATSVFGAAGVVGISLFSVTSSSFGLFGVLVFVFLPIILGWKIYRLSRVTG